jgi:glycosyltransferase involved in cell wall biosynthesis
MRVLIASVEDVHDIRSWSGTPHHMHASLVAAGLDVVSASPLRERLGLPLKAVQATRNALGGSYYSRGREPLLVEGYAAQIQRAVQDHRPDLIVAPSTIPVARLRTDVPIVTWTDATFAGMVGFYPAYTGLSRRYTRLGHEMERAALQRVALAVYSSAWAAESAVRDYGVPQEQVAVVPFGANIADPGEVVVRSRTTGTCRLLLVGRGWQRKGIDLAVDTTRRLREIGVPAELDVVGSEAPAGTDLPPWIRVLGSLEKDDADSARRMASLYEQADFFVLPTRADCTPVVLAEAQAYGVPVVTSDAGGTASMVCPRRSGWIVPLDRFASVAAEHIATTWASPVEHAVMRDEARRHYEEALNWPRSVQALLAVVEGRVLAARP